MHHQYDRPDWDPSRRCSGKQGGFSKPRPPPRFVTDDQSQQSHMNIPLGAGPSSVNGTFLKFNSQQQPPMSFQFDNFYNPAIRREPSRINRSQRDSESSQTSQPQTPRGSYLPRKTLLDTFVDRNETYWQNRVTVKIDVPFTDHSHVIGRGGKNTQRVMQETGCHIHFPDSNKNNDLDKSNQVTIAGPIDTVEKARSEIRRLSPLTITFELKDLPPGVDPKSVAEHKEMQALLNEYSDLVCVVRYNRSSGQPFCLLRGSVHQTDVITKAILVLQQAFCTQGKPLICSTTIDILAREQETVLGDAQGNNMRLISQRTGATVHFPSSGKSTTFHIKGQINKVLSARRHVIGCLPMTMSLEARSDLPGLSASNISSINHQLNVAIHRTTKRTGTDTECIMIRAMECNAGNLYLARQRLFGEDETKIVCTDYDFMSDWCRPQTYMALSTLGGSMHGGLTPGMDQLCITTQPLQGHVGQPSMVISPNNNNMISPNFMPMSPNTFMSGFLPYLGAQPPVAPHGAQMLYPPHPGNMQSLFDPATFTHPFSQPPPMRLGGSNPSSSSIMTSSNSTESSSTSEENVRLDKIHRVVSEMQTGNNGGEMLKVDKCVPSTPPNTPSIGGSTTPLPNDPIPGQSPIASGWLHTVLKIESGDGTDEFRKAPGAERKMNIELVETQAAIAMKHRVSPSEVRVPTDSWSGYGLSSSTPANVIRDRMNKDKNITNMSPISETPVSSESQSRIPEPRRLTQIKMQEGIPNNQTNTFSESFSQAPETPVFSMTTRFLTSKPVDLSGIENVPDFLQRLGLFKYTNVFENEEVDLETLVMLSEKDLKDLELPLGARAKILEGVRQIKNVASA